MAQSVLCLSRRDNQARGLAQYAIDFCRGHWPSPTPKVWQRVELFHQDSVACGVSAIAWRANAPTVLRAEAARYACPRPWGVPCLGSSQLVQPEKAVVANCAAVREWDANGTNFGYNPARGAVRGEFGHNDFYPAAVAGAQIAGHDGTLLRRAMLCLDEIRGRLAEVYGLRDHKIDHVVHGAIASAAVFGALVGANVDQIESAIGLVVAHYIPFRAIRTGPQLSDSKGASAAFSTELAILSVRRTLAGFVGPADIFRNPQALFCLFEPPEQAGESPFDLVLSTCGDDFAVMGMHFKLGLYEHQSAGALQGVIDLLQRHPPLGHQIDQIRRIRIRIYEPALSIIGDPAKRTPQTRQSADHSMLYLVATLLRKAHETHHHQWRDLMLMPEDYQDAALHNPLTRSLMNRIEFLHGGAEFDRRYPDGIPTQVDIELTNGEHLASGLVMYPAGHARCEKIDLEELLNQKMQRLVAGAVDRPQVWAERLRHLDRLDAASVRRLYSFPIQRRD